MRCRTDPLRPNALTDRARPRTKSGASQQVVIGPSSRSTPVAEATLSCYQALPQMLAAVPAWLEALEPWAELAALGMAVGTVQAVPAES